MNHQTKGERTRLKIIETAYELFIEKGYHGTSMRKIGLAANLQVASIYNHFVNKEAIFVAVVQQYHPINQMAPLLAEAEGETAVQLIHHAAHQMVNGFRERPGLLNLLFIALVEMQGQHIMTEVAQSFAPQIMGFVQRFMQLSAGRLRPFPPGTFFQGFISMVFGYVLAEQMAHNMGIPLNSIAKLDDMIDIFLQGIMEGD